jgi:hypothetical protein
MFLGVKLQSDIHPLPEKRISISKLLNFQMDPLIEAGVAIITGAGSGEYPGLLFEHRCAELTGM